jgi:hypothetical protein
MSAPTHEKSATDQPTQPLSTWQQSAPEHSTIHCQQSGPGVWAVPVTILAAISTGELIRNYVLLTDTARADFAIVALLLVFAASVGVIVCGHLISRRDGRGRD